MFGGDAFYLGDFKDNQYLSLISYNVVINKEDWRLGIDKSWDAVYLIDADLSREEELQELLAAYACHIESASKLIDELKKGMSDYLDVLVVVAGMILLVTVSVFYTVIRSDLRKRKTELYLYRIYGASFHEAQKVIFYEYIAIALITSFAVSFSIMFCGELYFYCGLKKHFPLSIPIMAATTGFAVLFIFICCQAAGIVNTRDTGLEVIRDE